MKKRYRRFIRLAAVGLCLVQFVIFHGSKSPDSFGYVYAGQDAALEHMGEPDRINPGTGIMTWVDTSSLLGWWEMSVAYAPNCEMRYLRERQYIGTQERHIMLPRAEVTCPCPR